MNEENNQQQNLAQNQGAATSDEWLPEELGEIKFQASQVAKTENGWQKDRHQEIAEVRELAASPITTSEEGIRKLETSMRNLGMPGIVYTGQVFNLLDKREEAMLEERALRERGQSYLNLGEPQKTEAEARIYNGYNLRLAWRNLFDYVQINHQEFKISPDTDIGKNIKRALIIMIGNEIRLSSARDQNIGLNFRDDEIVSKLSSEIANDREFISFLRNENKFFPNVTNIQFEIEKRIKKQDETTSNLQPSN